MYIFHFKDPFGEYKYFAFSQSHAKNEDYSQVSAIVAQR